MRNSGRLKRIRGWLGGLTLSVACAGCMIPVYHQPQGFSSTYYRHLQQSAQQISSVPEGPSAPPIGKSPPPAIPLENAVTSPTSDDPTLAEKPGSWWSWVRRPLTFGTRNEASEEDEPETDESPVESRASR